MAVSLVSHVRTVNIHEAKTHLSRLVEQAAQGEPFIIAKAGRPMVKVIPVTQDERRFRRRLGFMAGQISVPDDFNTLGQEEIERSFLGAHETSA
ncbi:MAG: type II toxin-antitoxin system Phd/YefM family antitoxin [Thiobacillaceae bacterium]